MLVKCIEQRRHNPNGTNKIINFILEYFPHLCKKVRINRAIINIWNNWVIPNKIVSNTSINIRKFNYIDFDLDYKFNFY